MKKYINKRFSKKIMLAGGLLIALSIALAFISLFSVYNKASESLNIDNGSSLETEQLLANIAVFSRSAGIIILLVGIVLYIMARPVER